MGRPVKPCEKREMLIMHLTRSENEGRDWVVFCVSFLLTDEACHFGGSESAELLL
jgi:hypothetical protein